VCALLHTLGECKTHPPPGMHIQLSSVQQSAPSGHRHLTQKHTRHGCEELPQRSLSASKDTTCSVIVWSARLPAGRDADADVM
jgi:hypothetical protein